MPVQDDELSRRTPIVGGQPFAGLPAAGAILHNGEGWCSGTLIGPRTVATAAHCADQGSSGFEFVIGSDIASPEATIRISQMRPHPNWDPNSLRNDIAIATLAEDAPVAPLGVIGAMNQSWVGKKLFFVGYGDYTPGTGYGLKRAVWIGLDEVTTTTFRYADSAHNTCYGDSGGPAFFKDENGDYLLAGVTSWGDSGCTEFGVDTRTDVFRDFLGVGSPTDPPSPPPPPPPPPPSDPTDPCNGETYEGRCDGNTLIYCSSSQVVVRDCTAQGDNCGWSAADQYYACLSTSTPPAPPPPPPPPPPTDPCQGETYEGRCDNGSVIWCDNGQIQSYDCEAQGLVCDWDVAGQYYNCL